MLEFLMSFITLSNILDLPLKVQIPGLIILGLLAWRAFRSLITLRLFKVITSVIMFFIVAVVLSRFGQNIVEMLEKQPPPQG